MAQAKNGDTVKVHYTGKLKDGTVFDTSEDREPLEFTIGNGQVIPGFETAVSGMELNETKTASIPAEKAYGPRREEMMLEVERARLPEGMEPEIGQQLQMRRPDGQVFVVAVADISDANVTLDANHPLAGKDLTFEIKLMEIV